MKRVQLIVTDLQYNLGVYLPEFTVAEDLEHE